MKAGIRFLAASLAPKPTGCNPWAWLLAAVVLVLCGPALGAEPKADGAAPADAAAKPKQPDTAKKLATEEEELGAKYRHLEEVLLRMAELSTATDPRRAALLKKAVAQSKDQLITVRFEKLVELLGKDQLARALENQTDLDQDLRALLDLLMSENRANDLNKQKQDISRFLKQLGPIIKEEQEIEGRTAGGDNPKDIAPTQGNVAGRTGNLAKEMQKSEAKGEGGKGKSESGKEKAEAGKGDGSQGKGKGSEGKGEGGQGKGKGSEGKGEGGQGKGKGSEGKGEGGQGKGKGSQGKGQGSQGQGQGKGGEGKPGEDQQEDDQAKAPNSPAKLVEKARKDMEDAEKELKKAQTEGALEKERAALAKLKDAEAKLKEILRQLRQEQITRVLALLEARFKKMLQMQQEVYEGTLRLDGVPAAERTHNHEIEASRMSNKESLIVVEVDKAALLLREDGSAVAFPEAVEQLRDDMQQVVTRLAQAKVGKMTQGIEEDIIAALKEMVEALKKAIKEQSDKQKPPKGKPGQPQEPPLVDTLAELRMIRALQMRVNTRTNRYSKMIEGEQADNAELVDALRRLAERQERIHRVTRDLQMGKNQ
jgi:hypothetical protein